MGYRTIALTTVTTALICFSALQAQTTQENKTKNKDVTTSAPLQDSYPAETELRAWRNTDSISVRYYGSSYADRTSNASEKISVSPGGRYFYVSSSTGDLDCDCIVRTLEVFDARRVLRWVMGERSIVDDLSAPIQSVTMRAGGANRIGSGDAIEDVRWNAAGTALTFLGTGETHDQVYRLSLPAGPLRALTHDSNKKLRMAVQNDTVMYRREVPGGPAPPSPYPIVPVPRERNGDVRFLARVTLPKFECVAVLHGQKPWVLPLDDTGDPQFWISPDGGRAIIRDEQLPLRSVRFLFVNLEQQQVLPISAGPNTTPALPHTPTIWLVRPQVLWSADASYAVIVNAPLPSDQSRAITPATRSSQNYVIAYHVKSGQWQELEPLADSSRYVRAVGWLKPGQLLITHGVNGSPSAGTVYTQRGDRWVAHIVPASQEPVSPPTAGLPGSLSVNVRQSANDPPQVVASVGAREKVLSRPDSALRGIWRARVESFSWSLPNGMTLHGGLALPQSTSIGTAPPLVIQVEPHHIPAAFLPDGHLPGPYALQALAGRGMAVLTVGYQDFPHRHTAREGATFVEGIDAAVEKLAQQNLVDPERVGLIGFSRAGYVTFYTVTHPGRTRIAAAQVADAVNFSYPEMLYMVATGTGSEGHETMNGGNIWQKPQSWLENDTLFNAHRMEAATLFTGHGFPGRTINEVSLLSLATIGALQANQRAFEYLFLPNAGHAIRLPRQRLAEMDATVDWMAFWLQSYEDPSAQKTEQYARWRLIRQRNEARKMEQRATGTQ